MNKNSSNLIARLTQRRRWLLVVLVLLVSGIMTFTVLAAVLDTQVGWDLRGYKLGQTPPGKDEINVGGALFIANDMFTPAGNWVEFLGLNIDGQEYAYTYDADNIAPAPSDNNGGVMPQPQFTNVYRLSRYPQAAICDDPTTSPCPSWTIYREIVLDLNQTGNKDEISLESFQVFTATTDSLVGFNDPAVYTGTAGTTGATLVYDLDGSELGNIYLIMMPQVGVGGSIADYGIYIPDSYFGNPPNCDFGDGDACEVYVYLWAFMGREITCAASDTTFSKSECRSNDGYDEFGFSNLGPLAVTLASFEAKAEAPGLNKLEWMTFEETEIVGFNILRSTDLNGERQNIANLISPQGSLKPYTFEDTDVQAGVTYYYWLEAVDINGSSEVFDPVTATWWWNSYIPMITR